MSAKRIGRLLLFLTVWSSLSAMRLGPSPQGYRFPMSGDEFLISGTFGELRPNHFHSGLDIKTGSEIGKPLLAVQEGYVYRVKVSPYGYGLAVYLRHPDGNFSVYGHMSRFSPDIEALVDQYQTTSKRYEQEIYLREDELPVRPGQLIGYSGNSGSSQGPHLHFEIRDSEERILNPLQYFRSLVRDDVPPVVQALALEPLNADARVHGKFQKLELVLEGKKGQYVVPELVEIQGRVGLEYQGYDLLSGAGNHCGINFARLMLDDRLIFELRLERFSFEEKKFINVHFDYSHHYRTGRKFERCYTEPWNTFEAYQKSVNHGVIELQDNREHQLRLELSDVHGNVSTVRARVRAGKPASLPKNLSYPELITTLGGQVRRNVFVASVCNPSTAHLLGLEAVYPGGEVKKIRPAWFEDDCLYYLLDLRQGSLPIALRDPLTGKSQDFFLRKRLDPARNVVAEEGELMAYFPEQSSFEAMPLHLRRSPGSPDMYSDVYEVGWRDVPLRAPFVLNMRPQRPGRPEHMVVAKLDGRGRWSFLGKELREDGSVYAASAAFGSFCVMADSTSPRIEPLNFTTGGSIPPGQESLSIGVRDDFSGIDSQRLLVSMDGKWILCAYDAKSNSLTHSLRRRPAPGPHSFEVLAYDAANNLATLKFMLYF